MLTEEDFALLVVGRLIISPSGIRRYYNEAGQLHRDGAPAVVDPFGLTTWFHHSEFKYWEHHE